MSETIPMDPETVKSLDEVVSILGLPAAIDTYVEMRRLFVEQLRACDNSLAYLRGRLS